MKRIVCSVLLICTSALGIAETLDVQDGGRPKGQQGTYVLVVGGISRDPNEREAKDKTVIRLRKFFLEEVKVASSRVSVLVDDGSSVRKESKKSTGENLKKELDALAGVIKPTDRFIFYYVGQANVVVETLRLNLPGKDITHKELAKWINRIKASSMLVVLDCPGAGLSARAMKGEGRIVVCGSRSDQRYSTRFSRYFVPALVDMKSDSNGDNRVSLLEAFTRASRQVDDYYRKQQLLTTETPVLEDDADGVASEQPWKHEEDEKDGLAASKFFLVHE